MPATMHHLLPETSVEDLDAYTDAGGGRGLAKALEIGPEATIAEVRAANLRGRGGAGFPTGLKWGSVRDAATDGPAYLVCNAAEGEPGTYKDRLLMERNPFRLVEGVLIAKHAVSAPRAYIALKASFTESFERVVAARDAAIGLGWEGARDLRIVPGPEDYLFGEESAMLEVVEGKDALPRILKPYQQGLFATMNEPNPTVVNNVETLSNVPSILAEGAEAFSQVGTAEAPGTMLFTVVGDVHSPGVYELPMGTRFGTLIADVAGGEDVRALVSGVSNTVITPALFDLPLDFDSFAEAGTGMGSGGFIVYSSRRDMVQVCAVLARFLGDESCGQCLACKLGTNAMAEALERLVAGEGTGTELEILRKRTESVTDGNRCYLPVGAALLIRSFLETFAEDFEAHLGRPSDADPVPAPKIVSIDASSGSVVYASDAA